MEEINIMGDETRKQEDKIPINLDTSFEIVEQFLKELEVNDYEKILRVIKYDIKHGIYEEYLIDDIKMMIAEALTSSKFICDENTNKLSDFFFTLHKSMGEKLCDQGITEAWSTPTPNTFWLESLYRMLSTLDLSDKKEYSDCMFAASCVFVVCLGSLYKTNDSMLKEFDEILLPEGHRSGNSVISDMRHALAHANIFKEEDDKVKFQNIKNNVEITMTKEDFTNRMYEVVCKVLQEPYSTRIQKDIKDVATDIISLHENKKPKNWELFLKCLELMIASLFEAFKKGFDIFMSDILVWDSLEVIKNNLDIDIKNIRNRASHQEKIIQTRNPNLTEPQEENEFKKEVEIFVMCYNCLHIIYLLPQVSFCLWHIQSRMLYQ